MSSFSSSIWSNWLKPRIEFIGVRNSWLIRERNSDRKVRSGDDDLLDRVAHVVIQLLHLEQLAEAKNRVHRGAQLVAHSREEFRSEGEIRRRRSARPSRACRHSAPPFGATG